MSEYLQPVQKWYKISDSTLASVQDGAVQTKIRGATFRWHNCSRCPFEENVEFLIVKDPDMSGQPHGDFRVMVKCPNMTDDTAKCRSLIDKIG